MLNYSKKTILHNYFWKTFPKHAVNCRDCCCPQVAVRNGGRPWPGPSHPLGPFLFVFFFFEFILRKKYIYNISEIRVKMKWENKSIVIILRLTLVIRVLANTWSYIFKNLLNTSSEKMSKNNIRKFWWKFKSINTLI